MVNGGRKNAEEAPETGDRDDGDRTGSVNKTRPDAIRRYLQIALAIVAGFILGAMVILGWHGSRDTDRGVRERVAVALNQGSVPVNVLLSETSARLSAFETLSPGVAVRADPGYRRYNAKGASTAGGPPTPVIAEAAAESSRTGYTALSLPFMQGGLWYAAIVKPRREAVGEAGAFEGIQFPVSRILEWWRGADLPHGSATALITSGGRVWLRDPFAPTLVGSPAADDPYLAAVQAGPSLLSRVVYYDDGGVDAIVGWRALESYGLVFAVGIDRDQVAGGWYGPGMTALVISLAVIAATFGLVSFAGREYLAPLRAAPAEPARPPREPAREGPGKPTTVLRAVADNMPVVVYEQNIRPGGEIEFDYVSQGLLEIHGIEPPRLRDDPGLMIDMVHEEDRFRVESEFEQAWRTGADIDTEYRIVMPDGQIKWVHNISRLGTPAQGGNPAVWDGLVFDVTAQKQTENELREARSEAKVTSRSKAEFLANASHELREPLNAIMGFAEIIGQQTFGPVGADKYVEYAHDIHESADHLLAVVNDILDLSKIEAGRATLVLEDAEAAELADSCLRLIHGRAADARLQLRRFVEDSLPRLRVDPLKVKQILINLLSNAIKFTKSGGTVTLRVVSTDEGGVAFSVSDTGIGIAKSDIAKVIESYGQVESGPGERYEGTGLGLPLAKALAELHGGELVIESSAGKGTIVTARFPPSSIAPAKRTPKE